jgi:acetyltransferase-like isoleucine patch superfamily enzyme
MSNEQKPTNIAPLIAQSSLLERAIDMPWIAINEIKRIIAIPFYRLLFKTYGVKWRRGWQIYGMPILQKFRGSSICIGDYASLRSWRSSNPLIPNHPVTLSTRSPKAQIIIGNHVSLTATILVAAERIEIGNHVWIGSNTTIVDTDFHPLDPDQRLIDPLAGCHAPVFIDDNVFIGMNCIILKGVHIGRSSVVGAGSVVVNNIPERTIVAGNPAAVIKNLALDS